MDDLDYLFDLRVRGDTPLETAVASLRSLGDTIKAATSKPEFESVIPVFITKNAAYTYVPANALDLVRKEGLLSGKLISKRPDILALLAANRGQDVQQFSSDFIASKQQRELDKRDHSDLGPSVFFGKPPVRKLPANHPIKKWPLVRVKIDLDKLRADVPQTRIHGMELTPFSEERYQQLGDDYAYERHRDLSDKEYRRLARQSATKLWQHYSDTSGKYYAADVPHAAVITPTGKIDANYLKLPSVEKVGNAYKFTGDVTGVGLRKTLHKILDEKKLPGVAYNDGMTGDVHAVIGGEDSQQQEALKLLSDYLSTGGYKGKAQTWGVEPTGKRERLRPVKLDATLRQRMFKRQGFTDYLKQPDQDAYMRNWIKERYRLQDDQEGNLVGDVPRLARRQLMGLEPIYPGQLTGKGDIGYLPPYWKRFKLPKLANYKAPFTVAVDFDGTLAEIVEPYDHEVIGAPRRHARKMVRAFKKAGARIIIWTVRGKLAPVEKWLAKHKIPYDFINENPDQPEGASVKIIADVYLDDRAINANNLRSASRQILRMMRTEE